MLLQDTIIELSSGIINTIRETIKLTGFMSEDRLYDYLNGDDCRYLIGVFPNDYYDIAYLKDNALFLIQHNNIEIERYKFVPIIQETIKYKDIDNILRTKTFTIRKCSYTSQYNYKDMEVSLLFESEIELRDYMKTTFNYELNLFLSNKT